MGKKAKALRKLDRLGITKEEVLEHYAQWDAIRESIASLFLDPDELPKKPSLHLVKPD